MSSEIEEYISDLFPDVDWTGHSNIHVSWYRDWMLTNMSDDEVLKVLYYGQVGRQIWGMLQKRFGHAEWILSRSEFVNLFLVDSVRHLKGLGDSQSSKKMKNPVTGNRFHRLAFLQDVMGGIRFWCDRYGDDGGNGQIRLGFRFRLEKTKNEEEERIKTRQTVDAATIEVQTLVSQIELSEPPTSEERVKIQKRVPVMEE